MSPELRALLDGWLAWAEAGGRIDPLYSREHGLCWHAAVLDKRRGYGFLGGPLCLELQTLLEEGFGRLKCMTPFNPSPNVPYWLESEDRAMHLNPYRLAWVRKVLS